MRLVSSLLAASLLATPSAAWAAHQPPAAPQRASAPRPAGLAGLKADRVVEGFRAVALYRNAANAPIGARFIHQASGFTFDLLQIQSVPQAFVWVNSWPTSDKGEPHTQEHLLLGKGNRGRHVASLWSMALADSTAFTEQRRTCYQFETTAGPDVFYTLFERSMDALLHPDYSDEEIRREVRNFGVAQNPGEAQPRLEEKGTVYNEMVSTFERPWTRAFHALSRTLYGPEHPLAYVAGGSPEALRELTPADIRRFHDANYHLANMGMVGSFPKEMPATTVLHRLNAILAGLERPEATRGLHFKHDADLPAPQGAPAGTIQLVSYPDKNPENPGQLVFSWPATEHFRDNREWMAAELFTRAIAGDATSTLYKLLIDQKTRRIDLGASGLFGYVDTDPGHPIAIGLSDVAASHLTTAEIARVRALIQAEIARIAAWPDGSRELAAFNARVHALIQEQHRSLSKFVNSPPGFGFRQTNTAWIDQLDRLNQTSGFNKSVTMDQDLAALDALLASPRNPWRDRIADWHLTSIQPYAVAARPDPALVAHEETARQARIASELARLEARYGTRDPQAAIRRYAADYDAASAALKAAEVGGPPLHFIDHPPLVLDPQLDYRVLRLAGQIPLVASTFDSMSSATVSLALKANGVPEAQLMYLAMLPTLLTQVGVIDHGQPVSFDEMTKRLRNEILELNAYYSRNLRTHRCELVFSGAGNDPAESARAVQWIERVAFHPDWRLANLARLRDVVDQRIGALHNEMKGAEERWVNDPADAYWRQDDPLLMATGSFLTEEYNAHRLRWQLKEAGRGAERAALLGYLAELADAARGASRADLAALASAIAADGQAEGPLAEAIAPRVAAYRALPVGARATAREAGKDLVRYLADLPDNSLAADWRSLCDEMRADLEVGPAQALAALHAVRRTLLNAHGARMVLVGARQQQDTLLAHALPALLRGLDSRPARPVRYRHDGLVTRRLRERVPGARPIFVGLLNPNTQSGVLINSAPGPGYADCDRESLLNFLASELYSGGGAHSMFMKTWAAGLAYSNGLHISPSQGQLGYYAERCPELPQTLRFVIGELKKDPRDPALVDYAVALAFRGSRAAQSYESRGAAIAADLADGLAPEQVRRFNRGLLALRSAPGLADELYARLPAVYAKVLPGMNGPASPVPGAIYFAIGPEKQLGLYEQYLRAAVSPDTRLYRLSPRDFWPTQPGKVTSGARSHAVSSSL